MSSKIYGRMKEYLEACQQSVNIYKTITIIQNKPWGTAVSKKQIVVFYILTKYTLKARFHYHKCRI